MADLSHRLRAAPHDISDRIASVDVDGIRKRTSDWRGDVDILTGHVTAQLEYCRNLRDSETLAALMQDDAAAGEAKQRRLFLGRLKGDIRQLNRFLCELLIKPMASRAARDADVDASVSLDAALSLRGRNVDVEKRTVEVEQALAELGMADTLPGVVGAPLAMGRAGDTKSKPLEFFATVQALHRMQQDLIHEVSAALVAKKKALDAAAGVTAAIGSTPLEAGLLDVPMAPPSPAVLSLMNLCNEFTDLESTVKQARRFEDGHSDLGAVSRLLKEQDRLVNELEVSQATVSSLKNRVNLLVSDSSDARLTSQQSIRLDKALLRVRHLTQEVKQLHQEQARLTSENVVLKERIEMLSFERSDRIKHLKAKANLFEPRIAKLTDQTKFSHTAVTELKMSSELLTSMYDSMCDKLAQLKREKAHAEAERDVISSKLHQQIQRAQLAHKERRRQELLTLRVTAAHKSVTEAYRALQADVTAAAEQAMAATRMSLHEERKALEAEIENLGQQVATGKEEASALKANIQDQQRQMEVLHATLAQREERLKKLEADIAFRKSRNADEMDETIDASFARVQDKLKLPSGGPASSAHDSDNEDSVEHVAVERVGK